MADETTTTDDTTEETSRQSDRVPYARYQAANEKLAAEKQRAAELEDRLEALEQRDKTDTERLTRELEKANKRLADAEARAVELESARERASKASLIASAAAKAKFHNPELASRLVDLDDIEDAHAAEAAIKQIAKDNPYLLQRDDDQTRQRLKRVGVDGQVVEEDAQKGLITEEEQMQAWGKGLLDMIDSQKPQEAI